MWDSLGPRPALWPSCRQKLGDMEMFADKISESKTFSVSGSMSGSNKEALIQIFVELKIFFLSIFHDDSCFIKKYSINS